MSDKESQDEEICALKSIYIENDLLEYDGDSKKGVFCVKVNSTSNKFELDFVIEKKTLKVNYLTPIFLKFSFPDDYPSKSPPNFTLNCRWLNLNQLTKLAKNLDNLWEKNANCPILFSWIYFLMEESVEFMDLNNEIIKIENEQEIDASVEEIDKRVFKDPCFIEIMRDYDKDEGEIKFQNTYHNCNVCFEEKSGFEMLEFIVCNHAYCNKCMKDYFEIQIKDGNVNSLTCPFNNCETQALPLQVFKLVDKETYAKYDSLLLRNSFNSMDDVIYCPRTDCQNPVIPDDTLAQCQVCNFAFCALCRQGYHGIEPCKITNDEIKKICYEYKNGDDAARENLVKRFGAKRLAHVIEENHSMELIENTSKQCPKCRSWMQKLDGCNKMTCIKCKSYFCWLCLTVLSKTDPYSHFNASDSRCFNRLFEGIENREDANNDNNNFEDHDEDDDDDLGLLAAFHNDPPPPPGVLQQLNNQVVNAPVIRPNPNRGDRFANADIDDVNFDEFAFNDDYEDFDDGDFEDDGWDDEDDEEEFEFS